MIKYNYELIRSNRKTISLSVTAEQKIIVRAPKRMTVTEIERFVNKHNQWIERHIAKMQERAANRPAALSEEEIARLKVKAAEYLPHRVEYFSRMMGVTPTGVRITSATRRWGSLSPKNSICFSYRLMLLPPDVIDYVVVHELSHIRQRNHSAAFYAEVGRYMPDYRERIFKLKALEPTLPPA